MSTGKKLTKTVFWILWNCLFGLASFLIVFFLKNIRTGHSDLKDFVKDGSIMFFCGALLGEASIGIMQKEGVSKSLNNFSIFASLGLLGVITIIYVVMHISPQSISYNMLYNSLVTFIVVSFVLSFILKFIYFNNRLKKA